MIGRVKGPHKGAHPLAYRHRTIDSGSLNLVLKFTGHLCADFSDDPGRCVAIRARRSERLGNLQGVLEGEALESLGEARHLVGRECVRSNRCDEVSDGLIMNIAVDEVDKVSMQTDIFRR